MLVVTYDYAVVVNKIAPTSPQLKAGIFDFDNPLIGNINPLFSAFECQAPQILALCDIWIL